MPFYEVSRWERKFYATETGPGFTSKNFDRQPSWVVEATGLAEVADAFPETDDAGGFLITPASVVPLAEAVADWKAIERRRTGT